MRTTIPAAFPGFEACDKLPGAYVDAYAEVKLDPENPTGIILDTTWGEVKLDLKTVVKAGETVTHLELAPESNPTVIRYKNEAGDYECISGDELSRIISMQLLKDVSQTTPPSDGDVYVYNGVTNLFEPFDLKTALGDLTTLLNRFNQELTNIKNRLTALETKLTPPADAPDDVAVCFSNINHLSDVNYTGSNTLDKSHGIYSHTLSEDRLDDLVSS